jgi:uncharacterized membrane protein YsdA (DUF1294 family)
MEERNAEPPRRRDAKESRPRRGALRLYVFLAFASSRPCAFALMPFSSGSRPLYSLIDIGLKSLAVYGRAKRRAAKAQGRKGVKAAKGRSASVSIFSLCVFAPLRLCVDAVLFRISPLYSLIDIGLKSLAVYGRAKRRAAKGQRRRQVKAAERLLCVCTYFLPLRLRALAPLR